MESVRAVTSRLVCLVVVAAVEVEVTGAAVRAEASLVKAAETVEGVVVRVGMTARAVTEASSRLACLPVCPVEVVTNLPVCLVCPAEAAVEEVAAVVEREEMTAKEAMEVAMEAVAAEGTNPAVVVEVEEEKAAAA